MEGAIARHAHHTLRVCMWMRPRILEVPTPLAMPENRVSISRLGDGEKEEGDEDDEHGMHSYYGV